MSVVAKRSSISATAEPLFSNVEDIFRIQDKNNIRKMQKQLECGPMPNVMVALPSIGGALCSMSQSLAGAHYLTAVQ